MTQKKICIIPSHMYSNIRKLQEICEHNPIGAGFDKKTFKKLRELIQETFETMEAICPNTDEVVNV